MYEVQWCISHSRDTNGAFDRFDFGRGRPGDLVIPGTGLALRDEVRGDPIDDVAVLRMHAYLAADPTRTAQHIVELPVVQHQSATVGHEHFQTAYTLGPDLGEFVDRAVVQVGDAHVHPVVDGCLSFRLLPVQLERVSQSAPGDLHGEVDDGRGTAHCGSDRARGKVIGRRSAHERRVQVGVHVDPTGQHHETGAVDDLNILGRHLAEVTDSDDLPIRHQQIRSRATPAVDESPCSKERAVHHDLLKPRGRSRGRARVPPGRPGRR